MADRFEEWAAEHGVPVSDLTRATVVSLERNMMAPVTADDVAALVRRLQPEKWIRS